MTRRRFSAKALTERLLSYGGKCAECRCRVGGAAGLEWDHIVPIELRGDDEIDNLQPLCRGCHRAKTSTDVGRIAKSKRNEQRTLGVKRQSKGRRLPGSRGSGWKQRLTAEGPKWERT